MKSGDVIESSIWMDGRETPEQRTEYEKVVVVAMNRLCEQEGITHSTVKFIALSPGDERVPLVPEHVTKSAEDLSRIRLLLGEALITGIAVHVTSDSLVANLEKKDLARLRDITRDAHRKRFPKHTLLDSECDEIIDALGPEVAVQTLRDEVVVSRFH